MKYLFSILLLLILSASCTEHYEKDFYGTYSINDSANIHFSKLTFYPNNTYSYYASTCLSGNHDSGSFVLGSNIIYFKSFNKAKDKYDIENNVHLNRTLTNYEFIYQRNRIGYINKNVSRNGQPAADTTIWTKEFTKN